MNPVQAIALFALGLFLLDAAQKVHRRDRRSGTSSRQDRSNGALRERLRRGEVTGDELAALFRSGQVRTRRNPRSSSQGKRRNAAGNQLETARRMARQFHGTDRGHVVELEPHERQVSRYGVVVGHVEAIEYQPLPGSQRAAATWRHESGDRGVGQPRAKHKPLLVVDPITKRPQIVAHRSPLRFSSRRGLVG